jgi:hypothetical protein
MCARVVIVRAGVTMLLKTLNFSDNADVEKISVKGAAF